MTGAEERERTRNKTGKTGRGLVTRLKSLYFVLLVMEASEKTDRHFFSKMTTIAVQRRTYKRYKAGTLVQRTRPNVRRLEKKSHRQI